MRPTLLGFRSPKEKTPDANYPRTTYDGRFLEFNSSKSLRNSPSFTYEKRFKIYEAKNKNYNIGPGSYSPSNHSFSKEKIQGGCVYKAYHGGKKIDNNGYYFVGNNLVFEPRFVEKSKRNSLDAAGPEQNLKLTNRKYPRPRSSIGSVRTETSQISKKTKFYQLKPKTPLPKSSHRLKERKSSKKSKGKSKISEALKKRLNK